MNRKYYGKIRYKNKWNFVDPKTKRHTQLIERLWGIAKNMIMHDEKRTNKAHLPFRLAEQWYRSFFIKNVL